MPKITQSTSEIDSSVGRYFEKRDWFLVDLRKMLKFNEIDPPLTGFAFGNKGLWLRQLASNLRLRKARIRSRLCQTM